MATITFDTLKFVEKLEKAGMSRDQASAIAEAQKDAFSEAMDSQIATKSDRLEIENRLTIAILEKASRKVRPRLPAITSTIDDDVIKNELNTGIKENLLKTNFRANTAH